jgi:serine/threonine protein phosphatase PrpC
VANKQFLTSIHLRERLVDKDEQNIHRLAGIVQPLRGIDHQDIKGFFSRPEIQRINLSPFKEPIVLVLATGATMEVLGSQEIIPLLQNEEEPADKLVKEAIKRKSEDNNTVIVIKLKN